MVHQLLLLVQGALQEVVAAALWVAVDCILAFVVRILASWVVVVAFS